MQIGIGEFKRVSTSSISDQDATWEDSSEERHRLSDECRVIHIVITTY